MEIKKLKNRFQELAGIKPIKEGFRDPEDNYGFSEKAEYFDAFLYFQDLAEKKGIPLTISNFAQFLDKYTDSIPDSLLKVINVETIKEASFDDKLKGALGMSDDEFKEKITSRDPEASFPADEAFGLTGYSKARDLIDTLRSDYRGMSDSDLDKFSKEMVEHFLDNTSAQSAAKIYFGKKGL